MITISLSKKYQLLFRIFLYVVLFHFLVFLISSISKKPLQIVLNINKSAIDVAFKVDYTRKRVDNINLKTPKPKLQNKQVKNPQVNLAEILKQMPANSKIEATKEKNLNSILNKLKPKSSADTKESAAKNLPKKIDKTQEVKQQEVKPVEAKHDKNLVGSIKNEKIEPEIKQEIIDEELVLGREQFDELKLSLQIHDQIHSLWQPPKGLNPTKPSRWLIKIVSGKKIIEKLEGSGILIFDMAAQRTLLNCNLDLTCGDLEIEISFTS